MDMGLWAKSRHPNYLGECLTWVGLWLMAIGRSTAFWWTGVGAIAILVMFYGVSIPWMDERSLANDPGLTHICNAQVVCGPIQGDASAAFIEGDLCIFDDHG